MTTTDSSENGAENRTAVHLPPSGRIGGQPLLRPMTAAEVERLVEWAAEEGWNPGLEDARTFYAVDPKGFMAAELAGELVGGGAIVRHHADFGFMGLFIIHPNHRGKGLGGTLWHAHRDRLASRLESGMALDTAWTGWRRCAGSMPAAASARPRATSASNSALRRPPATPRFQPVPVGMIPPEQLAALDRSCFPSPRDAYLRAWIAQPSSVSFASVEDGRCAAMHERPLPRGLEDRPVGGSGPHLGTRLFGGLGGGAKHTVFLDVPEANRDALAHGGGVRHAAGIPVQADVPRPGSQAPHGTDLRHHHARTGLILSQNERHSDETDRHLSRTVRTGRGGPCRGDWPRRSSGWEPRPWSLPAAPRPGGACPRHLDPPCACARAGPSPSSGSAASAPIGRSSG